MDRRRPRSFHLRSAVEGIKRERRLLSGLNNSRAVIEMLKPILTSATFAGVPALSSVTPAMAQGYGGAPGGSYLDTCREVRAYGDSLSAVCRRVDGSWQRTGLRDLNGCAGDIANMNGHLTCGRAGGYGSSYGPSRGPYEGYGRGGYGWGR